MTLHETIRGNIKTAMMAKDAVRLEVMRGLVTAFTNELVTKGKMPTDMLTDEETLAVITRVAKQRKDSISQFESAGRTDLVEEDTAQLKILEEFLPTLMSEGEIETFVKAKISEMGEVDKSKMGMFLGTLMKDLKGKADGAMVKTVVEKLLG